MGEPGRWVVVHWLRMPDIKTRDDLDLSATPPGASSWKIGPDGAAAADGNRKPSEVWCGLGIYPQRADAEQAFTQPAAFLPFLPDAVEAWHALLQPIAHRGHCNHLDSANPGAILAPHDEDPGGPLIVMTTAGFDIGPQLDLRRVVDFRQNVDRVRQIAAAAPGNVAHRVFAPHTFGDDAVTMTVWRDDAAMSAFAYRAGEHRTQIDRYKREQTADRTSFTRLRPVKTRGSWEGVDPVATAAA